MKTGLNETSVFAVFHPDATDLFNVCSSLEKVKDNTYINTEIDTYTLGISVYCIVGDLGTINFANLSYLKKCIHAQWYVAR